MHKRPQHRIEVFVDQIEQLFNSMDPSPFHERDLDDDAEEFIVSWAQEFPRRDPVSLVIHVNQLPAHGDAQHLVETAVHNYFAYRAKLNRLEFRHLLKEGRASLIIGLMFLGACLLTSELLLRTLVVRPGGRLASWVRGEHTLKVLVGYDFSAAGDAALRWVNQLREIGKVQTTVLYSSRPPDEARRLGYEGPLPLTANPKEIQKDLERDLANRVATFLPKQEVTAIVEAGWGNPEGYLFQMASRQDVDLIVVGTHQRHGLGRVLLGSVSRAVLHHAKVAVAVVPPAETAMRKKAT